VNGDGSITAFDVIPVVNWLNAHPIPNGAGEFVAPPESAGEFIPAEGSDSGEEPSSSAASTPLVVGPLSQGSSSSTPNERSTSPVVSHTADERLLYLSAVDQLMAASSEKLGSAGRPDASPVNWLEIGSLAEMAVRKRLGLRSR
jgi:hypothetical protein